jgi:NADPH:quinone reductase-like Zn-dependent oxidoreductase
MAKAIRLHQIGGPEVLTLEQVEVGDPGPGQARVRHTYVAVNFIDIYFRTGRYPMPSAPASPTSRPATASATCWARKARTPMCA